MRSASVPTSDDAGLHRLRALGHVAHDQDGLAQRGRLLMDTAGISEDQRRTVHERDHLDMGDRRDELDIAAPMETLRHHLLNLRVEMNRIDDLRIVARGDLGNGIANAVEAAAQAPPVDGR